MTPQVPRIRRSSAPSKKPWVSSGIFYSGAIIVESVDILRLSEYQNHSENRKVVAPDTDFKVSMDSYLLSLEVNPRKIKSWMA